MACERRGQIAKSEAMKAPKPHRDSTLAVEEMTERQAEREHARLEAEIKDHDERYYDKDAPTVSDAEYDALRRRYEAIEAKFPDLRTLESLSRKVGAAPSRGFAKVRHAVPMLSLAERVQRGGRGGFRRPHPPLPQSEGGREARLHRRAEDRRAVDVAALRGRRAGEGRHPRRRRRRRGRHRQYPHHERGAGQAQRKGHPGGLRGARRGLHDQGRRSSSSTSRPRPASSSTSIRATPRPARCGSSIRRSPRRGRCTSSPIPGAR